MDFIDGYLSEPINFSVKGRCAKGKIILKNEDGFLVEWESYPGKVFSYPIGSDYFWDLDCS